MAEWQIRGMEEMPRGDNPLGNGFYGYRRTRLVLPDGQDATYFGLMVGDCAHTLALRPDLTTFLVRQKRPNLLRSGQSQVPETWELPGGFVETELGLEGSAQKELRKEIGHMAWKMTQIGILYPSPGVSDEQDFIFLGTELEVVDDSLSEPLEPTEQDLDVISGPFGPMYDRLRRSKLPVAAQTLAAFSMAAARL